MANIQKRCWLGRGPTGHKVKKVVWGNIRTAFEDARREATVENFRFHDLRSTCASWLLTKGRHLKEVQEILGHQEFTMSGTPT